MKKISLFAAAALFAVSASAMEFQTLGYKSVSMGGAAVASSSGSLATYNNPALLANAPYSVEVSLGAGVEAHDDGAAASYKSLKDSGFIDLINTAKGSNFASLTTADVSKLIAGKDILINMNGNALEISPQAYFAAQIYGFGIGVFGSSDIVATANVNQAYNKLIFKDSTGIAYYLINDNGTQSVSDSTAYNSSSIEYAINNGLTYVQVKGIVLGEVPVAYGHKFELSGGNLMVGGAL